MSTINKIRQTLETAPAQLNGAREAAGGAVEIPLQADNAQSRMYEARALRRQLEPLERAGWGIEPGPRDFRTGEFAHIVATPPVEKVNTATLNLRDRIRCEARVRKPKTYKSRGYTPDGVDALEIDESAATVAVDTAGMSGHLQREIEHIVSALRQKGWHGTVSRVHGGATMTATLQAPKDGQELTPGQIGHFLTR